MSDFTPPFGQNGERRLPSATEQSLGLSCDPVQLRELLNGLFWLLEGQIKDIAEEAGVSSNAAGDLTVLKRSVQALIAAATGGEPEGYILMDQARSRLPIFPDVANSDGHLAVVSPSAGLVRVPAGLDFIHRGIFRVTTEQSEFPTDASKTYHLRWSPTAGFSLRDVASGTYNPGALAETNTVFDSTYDDMLVARVITNSSNVASITNLKNKDRLLASGTAYLQAASYPYQDNTPPDEIVHGETIPVNFARTPHVCIAGITDFDRSTSGGNEMNFGVRMISRYNALAYYQIKDSPSVHAWIRYEVRA